MIEAEDRKDGEITFCHQGKGGGDRSAVSHPFHLYDEQGIRENAAKLKEAFAWNKGYKEFFAVKATPNPF